MEATIMPFEDEEYDPSGTGTPGGVWSKIVSDCHILSTEDEYNLQAKLSPQSNKPLVDSYWRQKYVDEAAIYWDKFYNRNSTKFFKHRYWVGLEFKELCQEGPISVLELGCGVGNTVLPLLTKKRHAGLNRIVAVDYSKNAIKYLSEQPAFIGNKYRVSAYVHDFVSYPLVERDFDYILMVFVLSAVAPEDMCRALCNAAQSLADDGLILLRDYAMYDMTMIRFAPGSKLGESHYVRADGTQSFYFTADSFQDIVDQAGLFIHNVDFQHTTVKNRKKGTEMRRCFIQARIGKRVSKV